MSYAPHSLNPCYFKWSLTLEKLNSSALIFGEHVYLTNAEQALVLAADLDAYENRLRSGAPYDYNEFCVEVSAVMHKYQAEGFGGIAALRGELFDSGVDPEYLDELCELYYPE